MIELPVVVFRVIPQDPDDELERRVLADIGKLDEGEYDDLESLTVPVYFNPQDFKEQIEIRPAIEKDEIVRDRCIVFWGKHKQHGRVIDLPAKKLIEILKQHIEI